MDRETYVTQENWYGSYYELAIVLNNSPDNARLRQALTVIWNCSDLHGPWFEREDYSMPTTAIPELMADIEPLKLLYGLITIPQTGTTLGCLSVVVREDKGSDWLDLCIPTGMLGLEFPIQYPILRDNNLWLKEIDDVFLRVADEVYRRVPFDLALIGEEVSGLVDKAEVFSNVGLLKDGGYLLSPALFSQLSSTTLNPVSLPAGLLWIPF